MRFGRDATSVRDAGLHWWKRFEPGALATLGIEPFMDIKTEESREGTGYGSLYYAAFVFDLDGYTIEAVYGHAI